MFQIGDELVCRIAIGFAHHTCIYVGNNMVVEVIKDRNKIEKHMVGESYGEIVHNNGCNTSKYSREEIVRRAEGEVGKEWNYNILSNNCQTFTQWCQTNERASYQVKEIGDYVNPFTPIWDVKRPDLGAGAVVDTVAHVAKIALKPNISPIGVVPAIILGCSIS